MSISRYEILNENHNIRRFDDSPVWIFANAIYKDCFDNVIVAQLKMGSIINKQIAAVVIDLDYFDVEGKKIGEIKDYQFLDLQIKSNEMFGQKQAIVLPDNRARKIHPILKKVIFFDNTNWSASNNPNERIVQKQKTLLEAMGNNIELAIQFQKEAGVEGQFLPDINEDFWRCICGTANGRNEELCIGCGAIRNTLIELLSETDRLEERMKTRILEEQSQLYQQKEIQRRIQAKKTRTILFSVICAVILLLGSFATYVLIGFNHAKNLAFKGSTSNQALGIYQMRNFRFLPEARAIEQEMGGKINETVANIFAKGLVNNGIDTNIIRSMEPFTLESKNLSILDISNLSMIFRDNTIFYKATVTEWKQGETAAFTFIHMPNMNLKNCGAQFGIDVNLAVSECDIKAAKD